MYCNSIIKARKVSPKFLRLKFCHGRPRHVCATMLVFRDRKNHDSQRRDRIVRIFLRPEIGQFSPHFMNLVRIQRIRLSYDTTQKTRRKRKKSTGENSRNPTEKAARNCRSLSLVVEHVLSFLSRIGGPEVCSDSWPNALFQLSFPGQCV